jgi:hypothetical protein
MDYKLTEEYRDRFALNEGERFWMNEAFRIYIEAAKEEADKPNSIITPVYIEQLFKDINSKLDCWTD